MVIVNGKMIDDATDSQISEVKQAIYRHHRTQQIRICSSLEEVDFVMSGK